MIDILIIGKNGQLSSALIKEAESKKINHIALSSYELDITNASKLKKIIKKNKPQVIINTSAYHVLRDCENYPLKAFELNSVAVRNLAIVSKEINAKFVTLSTNYVFDGLKKTAYKESDIVNPLQVYGLSKLAGEIVSRNEYEKGTFIVRTCGLYGGKHGSKIKGGNFVLKILNESKKDKIIKASKTQIANPTYAGDLANAIIRLVSSKAPSGVYHLINENACSWYEFANKILKYKKINIKVSALGEKNNFLNYRVPINSELINLNGRKYNIVLPKVDEALRRYLDEL